MSDFQKLLGRHLQQIRKARKLSQEQLAEKTGHDSMSKSRISEIENGKSNMTMETLELIMNALEITPMELFNFNKFNNMEEIKDKKLLLDAHKFMLMERNIEEVKYVIRTTTDLFHTIDPKNRLKKK